MSNLLRVLSQIDKGNMQSLECEIPVELLEGLNIQDDGQVDLETLLKICHRVKRAEVLKTAKQGLKQEDREELYSMIYDSSRAQAFKHQPNKR